jgi:ABC-2 type transport system permease protein
MSGPLVRLGYLFPDSLAIATREVIRGIRERSRLLGSLARPFIWLFLLGTGLRAAVGNPGGIDYAHYIFPGMMVMNVLFASIMAGTSVIWDREFGFLKEILVAPVSRTAIALGKTLGGAVLAVIQGALVMIFLPFLGFTGAAWRLAAVLPCLALVALAITSLGMLIAVRMRSFEGFGVMNNFVVMPMFFLSGALYRTDQAPAWLQVIIRINPVNYGVDLVRSVFLGTPSHYGAGMDAAFLGIFTVILLGMTVFFFRRENR